MHLNFNTVQNMIQLVKVVKRWMLFILGMAIAHSICAQNKTLYDSERLSSTLITCICQDVDGYIWIGTEYGMNRFDGYRFVPFFYEETDSMSLADNLVTCCLCDEEGNVWVGCRKGLMRFDKKKQKFQRIAFPDGIKPHVSCLVKANNGNVLVGTAGYGCYFINNQNWELERFPRIPKQEHDKFCGLLCEDRWGGLWRTSHELVISRYAKDGIADDFISTKGAPVALLNNPQGDMLIVCKEGILRYDELKNQLVDAGYDLSSVNRELVNACRGQEGILYLATAGQGVFILDDDKGMKPVEYCDSTAWVNDLMEDRDGNLWVGCYKDGLHLVNREVPTFQSIRMKGVTSMATTNEALLLVVVEGDGVYCLNGTILHRLNTPVEIKNIFCSRNGDVWLSDTERIYQYDIKRDEASLIVNFGKDRDVQIMADDERGRIYLADTGHGVCIYNPNDGTIQTHSMEENIEGESICNNWIATMLSDRQGVVWMGTSDGLSAYDSNNESWQNYLEGVQCTALCEDAQQRIVIGTYEGLWRYNRVNNRMEKFPQSEEMKGKVVRNMVCDKNGNLWMSTNNGIWLYNEQINQWIGYTKGVGLDGHEYVENTGCHKDDWIAFASYNGVTLFRPDEVMNKQQKIGKVYLTSVSEGEQAMDCNDTLFMLPYRHQNVFMEFSLFDYRNIEDVAFEYCINNDKWITIQRGTNKLSLNLLAAGRYDVSVRAVLGGTTSEVVRNFCIVIRGPWYATIWAYMCYLLILLGVGYYAWRQLDNRRRRQMQDEKMRFIINTAHDIRSPLTMIMQPLKKLRLQIGDNEKVSDELDTVEQNATRLLGMVNQILDERKLEENGMIFRFKETNIVSYVEGCCSLYQYSMQQRNISFVFVHEQETITAWIDREQFDKVIGNLLSNSLKYTCDGGEVCISIGQTEKDVLIKVTDNGIGIKDEKPTKLFERFYQGKNATNFHVCGTGIGLNLSMSIVKMHGGTIIASNRIDGIQGAQFLVSIPRGKEHLNPNMIEESKSVDKKNRKQASRHFRILVADDDAPLARFIVNELSDWYHLKICANGKDALLELLTNNYDLLLSDIVMPGMDGIELLKQVKGNSLISHIPVILLTSKSEVENRLQGLKCGADAFIAKPFQIDELHILIDNQIDNVRRLRGKFTGMQEQRERVKNVEMKGEDDELMERVMQVINLHYMESDFNVELLAKELGISRMHLHRKIKEITGIGVADFIRNIRLEQAARLIKKGTISISQIAYNVGFSNPNHFSTAFKKRYGVTPSDFVRKIL